MARDRRSGSAAARSRERARAEYYDPKAGAEAFRMYPLPTDGAPFEPARTNYFTVLWIKSGGGRFWADAAEHEFQSDQLLFFVPYQQIRLDPNTALAGTALNFHANFLCVETFHAETGCSGTLFNDPYGLPIVTLDRRSRGEVTGLLNRMEQEHAAQRLAWQEVLLASMRILLILATRLKGAQREGCAVDAVDFRHPVLGPLRDLIEQRYRELHAPSDYAKLLHMTPKTLGRCVREQLGKTLTDLIRERILTHAKWQLLHTLKPVKEIAAEVGFQDELYFSRMFKKATGISPTYFRDFETEIRGGSNLSMTLSHAPIRSPVATSDTSSVTAALAGRSGEA